jgi:sigma-B regulation protein RsbU (phosphoserine phosphatase)
MEAGRVSEGEIFCNNLSNPTSPLRLAGMQAVMTSSLDISLAPVTPGSADAAATLGALDIAAYCHTLDGEGVGGDYCDIIPLGGGGWNSRQILVAIGDVTGHGVAAAMVMRMARGILRSRATQCGEPGELLAHLNALLVGDVPAGVFMTMHLARIDLDERQVVFAGAGHDPVMVYDSRCDAFGAVESEGVPLGIEADVEYASARLGELTRGQILVFGTDGLWETRNEDGEMFGKRRLRESIRRAAHLPAREMLGAVKRDLRAFRGTAARMDDVTLMIVKC